MFLKSDRRVGLFPFRAVWGAHTQVLGFDTNDSEALLRKEIPQELVGHPRSILSCPIDILGPDQSVPSWQLKESFGTRGPIK